MKINVFKSISIFFKVSRSYISHQLNRKRERMFSKRITILLATFHMLGFFPEYLHRAKSRNISIIVFTLASANAFLLAYALTRFFDFFNTSLSTLNLFIKYIMLFMCHCLVHLESFANRHIQRRFWNYFKEITKFRRENDKLPINLYILKYINIVLVLIVSQYFLVPNSTLDNIYTVILLFTYLYFSIICISRCFYYLFYVELMKFELQIILKQTDKMVEINQNEYLWKMFVECDDFGKKCFQSVREHYLLTHALSNCVNDSFGWSQIAIVLFLFYNLIVDLVWTYWYGHGESIFNRIGKYYSLILIYSRVQDLLLL